MIDIICSKTVTVRFSVPDGTRPETEEAIAQRLGSDTELVWENDPEGIKAVCVSGNSVWRPRKRFLLAKND
jgi:Fibrinogen alpha C domain